MAISAGVTFFAARHPIKTLFVLAFLLTGPGIMAYDYFTSYRATIQEALPIKPVSYNIGNSNLLYATWQNDNRIIIKGQLYGYARPGFKAWVLQDDDAILVYDETRGEIRKVDIRGLTKK